MMFNDEDFFEDDLDILDIIDNGFPRRIYERNNHFDEMDEFTFFKRFRLSKELVLELLGMIEHDLEYDNDLNNGVSPLNQLLLTLRFYSSASHLSSIADFSGVHTSTASRIITKVSASISRFYDQFIKMPQGQDEIRNVQHGFYQVASFPRVIGCVDGTHIRIQSPGGDEGEIYRNRKAYFSLNVQAICDSELNILDVVARWPGSTHDSTVFNNCRVKERFEAGDFPNCLLLGDSGYPLRNYFLTPLLNPATRAEHLYNQSHIRTRNCVERLFGVWKRRFPVLAYGMRLKLDHILPVITATAVLHNMANRQNEPEPPLPDEINNDELNQQINVGQMPPVVAQMMPNLYVRQQLINNYFANLL